MLNTHTTLSWLRSRVSRWLKRPRAIPAFEGSAQYWDQRYTEGGTSGRGSYGELAEFKANVLNDFVRDKRIATVIEFGCGDGNQLLLAQYPQYLGVDVSPTAIAQCREKFHRDATKEFAVLDEYKGETADLSMSLDVIYHLVEDSVYHDYMTRLFEAGEKYVIIYASNYEQPLDPAHPHVRHRQFTDWIARHRPDWQLVDHVANLYPYDEQQVTGSFADFYFFAPITPNS